MQLLIRVRPLSVNRAWQGRRFKTPECSAYNQAVAESLAKQHLKPVISSWYEIHYQFWIKNFARTDCDNLVKTLQDCIVRARLISDDAKIKKFTVEKFRATGKPDDPEGAVVDILPYQTTKKIEGE